MSSKDIISEKRAVSDFDHVFIKVKHEAELIITQGSEESLSIVGPQDVLVNIKETVKDGTLTIESTGKWYEKMRDAVKTSVTRKVVRYNLTVKNLRKLELEGVIRASASNIKSDSLWMQLSGAGVINFDSLETDQLDVTLPGTGRITLTGKATKQIASIKGAGEYYAPRLESATTDLELKGVGSATVWVTDDFTVTVQGVGSVSYYGDPKVKSDISAVGSLNCLGMPDW